METARASMASSPRSIASLSPISLSEGSSAPAAVAGRRRRIGGTPEVEGPEPGAAVEPAVGDGVEIVLHARRELEVDQLREVALEQLHYRERGEGRDQLRPAPC